MAMEAEICQAVALRFSDRSAKKQLRISNDVKQLARELLPIPPSVALTDQYRLFQECIEQIQHLKRKTHILGAIFHILTLIDEIAVDLKHVSTKHVMSETSKRHAAAAILHALFLHQCASSTAAAHVSLSRGIEEMQEAVGSVNAPIFPYYCGRDWASTLVKSTRPLWCISQDSAEEPELLFYSFTQKGFFEDPSVFETSQPSDSSSSISRRDDSESHAEGDAEGDAEGHAEGDAGGKRCQVKELLDSLFPDTALTKK